eukprot:s1341_g3.t4
MPPIWEVVGGADKGGILVRQGKELTSEPESSRLSTGALILEKEMHGERMRYFRLSGSGPEVGWVSLKVKDKAMVKRREEKRKPRVLALHGAPSNSNIMKFQTAQLRKLAGEDFEWLFADGRCAWKPLPGSKVMNLAELCGGQHLTQQCLQAEQPLPNPVAMQMTEQQPASAPSDWIQPEHRQMLEVLSRGPRMLQDRDRELVLEGVRNGCFPSQMARRSSDSCWSEQEGVDRWAAHIPWLLVDNKNGRQADNLDLDQVVEKMIEQFGESYTETDKWYVCGSISTAAAQRRCTPVEKAIAKDKPFVQWYSHPELSPEETAAGKGQEMDFDGVQYENVDEGVRFLEEYVKANAPIDVVVAFSQSGTLVGILMDILRKAKKPIPWQLTVLFCGAMIDDVRYALEEPLASPALYVHGGDGDPWGRHGERCLPKMYTELEMLEHEDGHSFPSTAPRASEIYQRVLQRMYVACIDAS